MSVTLLIASWLGSLAGWLLFSYVVIALFEWFLHAVLMHQPTWLSRNFKYFKDTLDEHRTFHHGHCFPGRKFDAGAEDQCMFLNIDLKPLTGLVAGLPIWAPLLWFAPFGAIVFIVRHTVDKRLVDLEGTETKTLQITE